MSEPYEPWPSGPFRCPYCKAEGQEAEDLGDHPAYLSGTCEECGKDFSVNTYLMEFYDNKGDVIK
jgi:predicted nucleic acid binding AN1-type Zn finger protein